MLFIRQSIRSDYCAVYATAMYLSLLGHPTTRQTALRMFGARPGTVWPGASQADMLAVVRRHIPGFASRWRRIGGPCGALLRAFEEAARRGLPALVAAHCRHRSHDVECGHAFLLTGMTGDRVLLLDPLCPAPAQGSRHNASLRREVLGSEQALWTVERSAWDLMVKPGVALLQEA